MRFCIFNLCFQIFANIGQMYFVIGDFAEIMNSVFCADCDEIFATIVLVPIRPRRFSV